MAPSVILPEHHAEPGVKLSHGHKNAKAIVTASVCAHGNKLTIEFADVRFVFHSQWLYDARMDGPLGAARNVDTAICAQTADMVRLTSAIVTKKDVTPLVRLSWANDTESQFPIEWLRIMGPLVANPGAEPVPKPSALGKGWRSISLKIPEFSYKDIVPGEGKTEFTKSDVLLSVIDQLLHPTSPGIIKIVDMPPPNMEDELNHVSNLNTRVLKHIFGSVFVHPTRGQDKSFNVSSRAAEADKRKELPNYDTNQVLLPHADHAFYEHPINVQGWYILEGTSENTFVSTRAALQTLEEEDPEAYRAICETPMTLGRVSAFYGEPVYQMTVDTAVTTIPGTNEYKRIRWHPNFIGSLLCPYEAYQAARTAQQKFLEIMRRPDHQLNIELAPGDFFIWDNFRVLHGREKVFSTPRTGVGQTVTEQVVHDTYRRLCIEKLDGRINDQWLVHMPMPQLRELLDLVESGVFRLQ